MASETLNKLGKLSLSILENFVASHLGIVFIEKLKDPYEKRAKFEKILVNTEARFISEHKDHELSKAMFEDLSQKDRPDLAKAIKYFYENPARDISFRDELFKILFDEFKFLARERIDRASNDYIRILKEEIANEDENFRSRLLFLITSRNSESVRDQKIIWQSVNDFSNSINEKTHDFVGRDYLFRKVDGFISNYSRGYFFIVGEPGIGKTTFLANLISRRGFIHHFNSLTEARNTPQKFYENICAQLILKYSLDYAAIPNGATEDARFFTNLLNEIIRKEGPGTKIVIAIDALDEVSHSEMADGANVLFLPQILPQNVYVISTTREIPKWKIDCEYDIFDIKKMSPENQKDIEEYLLMKSETPGIRGYLNAQTLSRAEFVRIMKDKSEGNFMYLRYVLPEIAVGAYTNLDLMELPQGLRNYYEDHWRRMKGKDQEVWFKYKLPAIMVLSVGEAPMSISSISQILNIPTPRVADLILEWGQFLNKEETIYNTETTMRYRFYHLSFIDFLHNKEEVKAERVDFNEARQNILDFFERETGNILDD